MHVNGFRVGGGGGTLLSSIQPACLARKVKVPLSGMPLDVRVIELPSCMPLNILIFFLPLSVSLCLHKALHFRMLLMPSEFLTQKDDSFKLHLFDIYKARQII